VLGQRGAGLVEEIGSLRDFLRFHVNDSHHVNCSNVSRSTIHHQKFRSVVFRSAPYKPRCMGAPSNSCAGSRNICTRFLWSRNISGAKDIGREPDFAE